MGNCLNNRLSFADQPQVALPHSSHSKDADQQPHRKEHRQKAHNSWQQSGETPRTDDPLEKDNEPTASKEQRPSAAGHKRQVPHDYKFFAKGMDMAIHRHSQRQPKTARIYSAILERLKESRRQESLMPLLPIQASLCRD